VIDAQGRLVGVAVAKVRGSNIGMAIPAPQLTKLLSGNVPSFTVTPTKVENGTATVQILARVADPLRQLKNVTVYYVRGNAGADIRAAVGVQQAGLLVNGERATGQLALPTQGADNTFSFQVGFVNAEGQAGLTAAQVVRIDNVAPPPPPPRANVPPPAGGANVAPPGVPAPAAAPRVLAKDELDQALQDLAAGDFWTRKRAADLLAGAEPKDRRAEVVKALEPLLNDSNLFLRQSVIKALGLWGGKDSVPKLLPLLKDTNVFVQQAAVEALGKTKDEKAAEPVADCLPNFHLRGPAATALKAIGTPAEKPVLKYLAQEDIFLRRDVCGILKDIGTKASLPQLEELVKSDNIHIKVHVAPTAQEAIDAIKARR
jgi:hypothetical protein